MNTKSVGKKRSLVVVVLDADDDKDLVSTATGATATATAIAIATVTVTVTGGDETAFINQTLLLRFESRPLFNFGMEVLKRFSWFDCNCKVS
mmetsp:Transcript_12825/g.19242  ORF Transcript_12825/g.19242 Transcript_12825/m.19242 type:complete len:92 (-) Transcript_12825:287-562(-)